MANAHDVDRLVGALRAPGFRYHELARPDAARPERPRTASLSEVTIALVSPLRGAGRSTVAAALAWALARRGRRTLAVDADPGAGLRRHLGAAPLAAAAGAPGYVAQGAAAGQVLDALGDGPDALVIDAPAGVGPAVEDAVASADEVVALVRADAAAGEAAAPLEALLARAALRRPRRLRVRWVVNAYDARDARQRAGLRALRAAVGPRLWPRTLQADAAAPQALAARRPVADAAPASQLAADLEALADAVAGPPRETRGTP